MRGERGEVNNAALKKDRLSYQYRRVLTWALKHRLVTLAASLVFLVGSIMLVPHIPVGLFGNDDVSLSIVNMELPPGSTMETTDRTTQQLTTLLLKNSNVTGIQTDEHVNKATFYVKLKPKGKGRDLSRTQFENEVRPLFRQIPGVRLSFEGNGFGGSKELSIVLKSEDAETLTRVAESLETQMRQVPGLVEVASSASLVKPEILIRPKPQQAADQGVTVQTIARTANLATLGDFDANLAKFDLPDRQIPIRVQLDPQKRNDIDTIRNLQVQNQSGALIPLQSVADISFGNGPSQIDRYNRSRKISIEANLQGRSAGGCDRKSQQPACPEKFAAHREAGKVRQCQNHARTFYECGDSPECCRAVYLRGAGAAVWRFSASADHYGGTPLFAGWCTHSATDYAKRAGTLRTDWHCAAVGLGDQKLHPAGGLRADQSARGQAVVQRCP